MKGVVVKTDELISRIQEDHKNEKKVQEPLSINVFITKAGANKSTTGVNGQFVFSQVLIDCLLRLKSTDIDKNELIDCCQIEYQGNEIELNNLREFQAKYSSDKALWWYTRESFFYKILNAALRTQNIHMIFLFRAFIGDMSRQLQKKQANHPLRVYRSQLMSTEEIRNLKQHINQLISVNSFFSTTRERDTALFLLGNPTSQVDLERVLFEIDADPKIITTKPFADISGQSYFPSESEVLFMLGSIFRLENIHCNDEGIWIMRMTLCNDNDHDLKQVLMHMKQQIGDGETNLRILGKILWKMGILNLAEKYFNRLLKELPLNDPLLGTVYKDLGELASLKKDYDMSMHWHQKSLEFHQQNQVSPHFNIGKFIQRKSSIRLNHISCQTLIFVLIGDIASVMNARQKLVTLIGDVCHADGRQYDSRDHRGNKMDCVKIIKRPDSEDFIGVYHTFIDNIPRVNLAVSNDLLKWTWLRELASFGSQPTIAIPRDYPQGYIVAWEQQPYNHLQFAFYPTWSDLQAGTFEKTYAVPRLLSCYAEGTPNIYGEPTLDHIDVGFHFYDNGVIDRQARGTLKNFNQWTEVRKQPDVDNAILHYGVQGSIGDRDALCAFDGFAFTVIEGQYRPRDFGTWRIFVYDHQIGNADQVTIVTDGKSQAFSNPSVTLTTWKDQSILIVTLFVPSEEAAPGEAGELIYYRKL